ncbi:hypothetical protein VTO42DRAFT_3382 [Malbranchea cinnamomea]
MSQRALNPSPHPSSATQLETADAQASGNSFQRLQITGTLRLRGDRTEHDPPPQDRTTEERRIRWAEDVVDNEGQGKKSSKVCCIYHKPRAVGESSSESESDDSSSSDDDSDSEVDNGEARLSNNSSGARRHRPCDHHGCEGDGDSQHHRPVKKKRSRAKPNAYERMPRYTKKSQS